MDDKRLYSVLKEILFAIDIREARDMQIAYKMFIMYEPLFLFYAQFVCTSWYSGLANVAWNSAFEMELLHDVCRGSG